MTCSSAREIMGALLDGELDASAELEARSHVATCQDCANLLQRLDARQQRMREGGLSYKPSPALEARIRNSIQPPRHFTWRVWASLAAAILLITIAPILWWQAHSSTESRIAEQAVSSHVRALITGHVADVASTDRHTVKPWFNSRIDFSPPVNDLSQNGFPLIGGRLDYLDRHTVAALIYLRRKHVIDLFVWPSAGHQVSGMHSDNGYNVLLWSTGNMSYAAASDLSEIELRQFKDLLSLQ